MSYSPSPRALYDEPTAIRYESVTRHLWGDDEAGQVADWIYVSNAKIHQIIFGLPVGAAFRHSDSYRTIFAADVTYIVLEGEMVLANPQTGEVQRARAGESIFFRRDTWHHGFNIGAAPLRVLEYFAPPPLQGTSGAYARTKENLTEFSYGQDQLLGHWNPLAPCATDKPPTLRLLRADEVLWRMVGKKNPVLVGILASTEHLTVGQMQLQQGQKSEAEIHGGDESLYVLEGTLNIHLPEHTGARWHELRPGDGFYIPEGVPHEYHNIAGQPARFVFGVAPTYLAPSKTE